MSRFRTLAHMASAVLTGSVLLVMISGCSPLQPGPVTTIPVQKQALTLQLGENAVGKPLLLRIFDVNTITQEEKLELEWNEPVPADGKIPLELSFGTKSIYGQLSDPGQGGAVIARQHQVERIEVGKESMRLKLDGKNIIKKFGLDMVLKTIGDLDKAKAYFENDDGSPRDFLAISCAEHCHSSIASDEERVYPYFDTFPFVAKNPAYQDMAVLTARMIKDMKRNPRDPEVMPPGEGVEDPTDLKAMDSFAGMLSQTVEAEKYPITRIELSWQLKNMPAIQGKVTLSYDSDNTFTGTFPSPLFKTDTIIGTLTAFAGKDKEVAIVKDAALPPVRISLRSHLVTPQVAIDKSKVVIIIETHAKTGSETKAETSTEG